MVTTREVLGWFCCGVAGAGYGVGGQKAPSTLRGRECHRVGILCFFLLCLLVVRVGCVLCENKVVQSGCFLLCSRTGMWGLSLVKDYVGV